MALFMVHVSLFWRRLKIQPRKGKVGTWKEHGKLIESNKFKRLRQTINSTLITASQEPMILGFYLYLSASPEASLAALEADIQVFKCETIN